MRMLVWIIGRKRYERWLERAAQALLDVVSELADASQEELLAGIRLKLRELMDKLRVKEHA
jgi:hypothetical protein